MRLSHRDFKAANLHVLGEPGGPQRLMLIDLQGAFLAPPEYDLVCLLRDSHVPLTATEITQHIEQTRPLLPDAPTSHDFSTRFALLTLSRVGKDCSHYIHAATDVGDLRYLPLVPAGLDSLEDASTQAASWDPRLARLAELIQDLPRPNAARLTAVP